ncbi:SAF domain-containing protein [uncultured Salinibacterium sp.]|uniref:SAF domain-containing protein n=1 Tax=uncultured Salinibacterium sp. TaxID=459274 RepID=UPI0030DCE474|tara:strand:- start:44192 stop:44839 length:648 start_codon:yes stop_codon:yes gene_type:complete
MSRRSGRTQSHARARAFALDPRLAIGIVLVVASVVGVVSIVAAADDSTEVYAAASTLTPGDRVLSSDLVVRNVKLNEATDRYIARGELPPEGFIATRPIEAGELVPTSSLGSHDGLSLTSVVVSPHGGLSGTVTPGASVDVWASAETESGEYGAPGVIISGAIVVRLLEDDSLVTSAQGSAIELLVPRSRVARVLEAMANGDVLSVIPANLPAKG